MVRCFQTSHISHLRRIQRLRMRIQCRCWGLWLPVYRGSFDEQPPKTDFQFQRLPDTILHSFEKCGAIKLKVSEAGRRTISSADPASCLSRENPHISNSPAMVGPILTVGDSTRVVACDISRSTVKKQVVLLNSFIR